MSSIWWESGLALTTKPVEMFKFRWWWLLLPCWLWTNRWLNRRQVFPAGTVVSVRALRGRQLLIPPPHDATVQILGHSWHPLLPRWYRVGKTDEYRTLSPLEQLAYGAFEDGEAQTQDQSEA